ncbi:MAG: CDGSH iron-sulfur domain-containing protein [Mycobacteriales bacterium]
MAATPRLTVASNGPYVVTDAASVQVLFARSRADVTVGALTPADDGCVRLCRCGHSAARPICDDSCTAERFLAIPGGEHRTGAEEPGVCPRLAFVQDGPVMVAGLTLTQEDGSLMDLCGREVAMCRCGASRSKPWCDFSHLGVGFKSR